MNTENKIKISTLLNSVLAIVFILFSILITTLVYRNMKLQALNEAKSKAMVIIERNLATHEYFSHKLKPAEFMSLLSNKIKIGPFLSRITGLELPLNIGIKFSTCLNASIGRSMKARASD